MGNVARISAALTDGKSPRPVSPLPRRQVKTPNSCDPNDGVQSRATLINTTKRTHEHPAKEGRQNNAHTERPQTLTVRHSQMWHAFKDRTANVCPPKLLPTAPVHRRCLGRGGGGKGRGRERGRGVVFGVCVRSDSGDVHGDVVPLYRVPEASGQMGRILLRTVSLDKAALHRFTVDQHCDSLSSESSSMCLDRAECTEQFRHADLRPPLVPAMHHPWVDRATAVVDLVLG